MDSHVYIKNNTIYFDLGNMRAGEIDKIEGKIESIINELECPFDSISILDRMIETNVLIHPEDFKKFMSFAKYLNDQGRDLSVWVVPESSILYKTSLKTIPSNGNVKIADNLQDAEQIVEQHRIDRVSYNSTSF